MVLQRTLGAFGLFDVIADLFPGAILLIGLLGLFPFEEIFPFHTTGIVLTSFIVLSYFAGHVIQWLMGQIGDSPNLFIHSMEAIANDEDPPISIPETEDSFLELCRTEFKLSNNYEDYGTLF